MRKAMASQVHVAKHPIHPMLVVFPIGLWILSLVCDLIFYMGWGELAWDDTAFYTMAGGIVGALLAAIPGLVDFLSIPSSWRSLKEMGLTHMVINLCVVALFSINLWWRMDKAPGSFGPIALSILGGVFLAISGWLGSSMVDMVDEDGTTLDLWADGSRGERMSRTA
jgi:uncharacterized membrane protein